MLNTQYKSQGAVIKAALFILMLSAMRPVLAQHPMRIGLWVIRDQLTSAAEINQVIDFAHQNGITDLFVQVRGRGDAYYHSTFICRPATLKGQSFDPLQYCLNRAHAKGIKVHAWINIYLLWSARKKPQDKEHLFYQHPEWCAVDDRGTQDSNRNYHDFQHNNTEGIYLSPLVPEVNAYLVRVVKELVNRYAVDGIHYDYIRYPKNSYGFHIYGRRKYKEETGIDPVLLTLSDQSYYLGLEGEKLEELVLGWQHYRCDAISQFARKARAVVTDSQKPILISAAVKPNPREARDHFYQDWVHWLNEGWLDFVVPMNYTDDVARFERNHKAITRQVSKDKVWMGIGVYNQDKYNAMTETLIVRTQQYNGVVFFAYKTFRQHSDYFPAIRQVLEID